MNKQQRQELLQLLASYNFKQVRVPKNHNSNDYLAYEDKRWVKPGRYTPPTREAMSEYYRLYNGYKRSKKLKNEYKNSR